MGVFLGPTNPGGMSPPATLDFSTQQSRDFAQLSPQINQVFFIGDGRRDNGAVQRFVVPRGRRGSSSARWTNTSGTTTSGPTP